MNASHELRPTAVANTANFLPTCDEAEDVYP
jgi:hypothetical protein